MDNSCRDQAKSPQTRRVPGKNISKLKKFFDSCEESVGVRSGDGRGIGTSKTGSAGCEAADEKRHVNGVHAEAAEISDGDVREQQKVAEPEVASGKEPPAEMASEVKRTEADVNINMEHADQAKMETSNIPYCRKAVKKDDDGLWKNADSQGLWNTSSQNGRDFEFCPSEQRALSSSLTTSTKELNDLIAVSRAEQCQNAEDPLPPGKSNLESYFTSFETHDTAMYHPSLYDCDANEMSFEDEDAILSDDTSSEEELRCHPAALNTNYLPAYSLHTIIEESCEESERDSRTNTPTNKPAASKLERYFSWDIINDATSKNNVNDDVDSTVYSDSLSEDSGSLIDSKEIDPSQLASSRLEKYFTSGLLDDQNYFYPDDAEFLDDTPISDFEEDTCAQQKISRSALLSSLETKPESQNQVTLEPCAEIVPQDEMPKSDDSAAELCIPEAVSESNCDNNVEVPNLETEIESVETADLASESSPESQTDAKAENLVPQPIESSSSMSATAKIELIPQSGFPLSDPRDSEVQKKLTHKDQLSFDIQGIIKKLVSYFTDPPVETYKQSIESDYISAWEILETEIELLLQSISPRESNSCNSSTIDSNNSDYGSDTVESVDCILTDEDDNNDAKKLAKFPLLSNPSYKNSFCNDLSTFNISDETLSIWKRLIQSLQKDNFLSKDQICDLNAEARVYIRDQIVTLMHTVTESDANLNDADKLDEVSSTKQVTLEAPPTILELSEAPHESNLVQCLDKPEISESVPLTDTQPSDEVVKLAENEPPCPDIRESSDSSANKSNDNSEVVPKTEIALCPPQKPPRQLNERNLNKDSELKFNVIVDIELGDETATVTEHKIAPDSSKEPDIIEVTENHEITLQEDSTDSGMSPTESFKAPLLAKNPIDIGNIDLPGTSKDPTEKRSSRDTGYFSHRSSDDSLLNTSSPSLEVVNPPNFKSLKRTIKKFPLTNALLSRSTNNIFQAFSTNPGESGKSNTLQAKPKKPKSQGNMSSPKFSDLFSPSAVLRKFTGAKGCETPSPESTVPAKYMKKYARSNSVESDSIFGALSMPQLNSPKPGDSYSALGLYSENDRDSSIMEEVDTRPNYFSGSQSVLSLGSMSASMLSVYSSTVPVTGDVLFGLNYNQKSQAMEVFVKQCRNIAAVDARHSKSNPYVKAYLLPDKTRSGKRKTKVKKNTLNPVFNELLRFPVQKNELESRTLWLTVWNSDLFGKNDFLGEISLPLGYRLLDSPTLRWYPLQERVESLTSPLVYRGEMFIALKYVPKDLSLEPRFRPAPVISVTGALHVLIKEAKNIATNRVLDAFCKSYLLPDKSKGSKQKTPVVRRSRHPKWYYTMIYEDLSVEDLRERSLELTVWDHDTLSSNEFMGALRLNTGTGLYHGLSVDWMDAKRDESSLWNAMLESPNMWVDGCLPLRPNMTFQ